MAELASKAPATQMDYDVAVVGAGPAGIAAACVAAEAGRSVALLDATPWLGGQIWRKSASNALPGTAAEWLARLERSRVQVLGRTTVVAVPGPHQLLAESPRDPLAIGWRKLILATGARELFLPFPGWTLLNVVGPGGLQVLTKSGWPMEGKRVVVAGSGPLLIAAAAYLRKAGAQVLLIAEQADWSQLLPFGLSLARNAPDKLLQAAQYQWKLLGVPYRPGCWPVSASGREQLETVTLRSGERTWTVPCDYLACGFGLVPNVELAELLGCQTQDDVVTVSPLQETSLEGIYAAGECTGISGVEGAIVEGRIAGHAAAGQPAQAEALFGQRARTWRFADSMARAFALRPEVKSLAAPDTTVCRCEDVSLQQLRPFDGWRAAKLHTRCGMGPCQGRVCGGAARVILGWHPTSVRPPLFPTSVETLAAACHGAAPAPH